MFWFVFSNLKPKCVWVITLKLYIDASSFIKLIIEKNSDRTNNERDKSVCYREHFHLPSNPLPSRKPGTHISTDEDMSTLCINLGFLVVGP